MLCTAEGLVMEAASGRPTPRMDHAVSPTLRLDAPAAQVATAKAARGVVGPMRPLRADAAEAAHGEIEAVPLLVAWPLGRRDRWDAVSPGRRVRHQAMLAAQGGIPAPTPGQQLHSTEAVRGVAADSQECPEASWQQAMLGTGISMT